MSAQRVSSKWCSSFVKLSALARAGDFGSSTGSAAILALCGLLLSPTAEIAFKDRMDTYAFVSMQLLSFNKTSIAWSMSVASWPNRPSDSAAAI